MAKCQLAAAGGGRISANGNINLAGNGSVIYQINNGNGGSQWRINISYQWRRINNQP
jgi:hypothetical protein